MIHQRSRKVTLAIVLDEEVVSAPVICGRIGARGQIDLGSLDEARDLAVVLRAGALCRSRLADHGGGAHRRAVARSQDSVASGSKIAGMIRLGVVVLATSLIGYYHLAGLPASGAGARHLYAAGARRCWRALGCHADAARARGHHHAIGPGMAVDAGVIVSASGRRWRPAAAADIERPWRRASAKALLRRSSTRTSAR